MTFCCTSAPTESRRGRDHDLVVFDGLGASRSTEAGAGDIVAIAGFPDAKIGATLTDPDAPEALPVIAIEEPTLKLTFGVNTSPFAGREGQYSHLPPARRAAAPRTGDQPLPAG